MALGFFDQPICGFGNMECGGVHDSECCCGIYDFAVFIYCGGEMEIAEMVLLCGDFDGDRVDWTFSMADRVF